MATGFPDSWVSNAAKFLKKTWVFNTAEAQIVADLADAFIWDSGDDPIIITKVTASARNVSGDNVGIDVNDDGTSIFDTEPDLQAAGSGAIATGAIDSTKESIAANSKLSLDIICNTNTPELDDLTIVVEYRTELHGGD